MKRLHLERLANPQLLALVAVLLPIGRVLRVSPVRGIGLRE